MINDLDIDNVYTIVALNPEIRKKYEFNWQIMDVIVSGKSALDSARGLNLKSQDEIARFLECYGYDLENPIERAELFGNFQEAIQFIRHYFLKPENPDGLELELPRKISEITDISQLLMMASGQSGSGAITHWACAVIKVMHTIAHMDKDLGAYYFTDVQKQILDRFYRYIHSEENQVYLGKDPRDTDRVDLIAFESKPKKSRESVILKLLHKPENVAEEIFDRVGIRFITKTKFDSLRVIKFLKDRNVIMPANIKPSRSRNSLIDLKNFNEGLNNLFAQVEHEKINSDDIEARLVALCESFDPRPETVKNNPHTSSEYRSIQFTGRQLIKLKNPLYEELKALKSAVKGAATPPEITKIADRIDLKNIQRETRFFYPFEVQIYDEEAYKQNLAGQSSHANYKKSQIRAAMIRVMGPLIPDAKTQS